MSSPDESFNTIVQEETCLQSAFLSNFFGVEAMLCIFVFFPIFKRRTPRRTGIRIGLLTYLAVLFAVTTSAQELLLDWIIWASSHNGIIPVGRTGFTVSYSQYCFNCLGRSRSLDDGVSDAGKMNPSDEMTDLHVSKVLYRVQFAWASVVARHRHPVLVVDRSVWYVQR